MQRYGLPPLTQAVEAPPPVERPVEAPLPAEDPVPDEAPAPAPDAVGTDNGTITQAPKEVSVLASCPYPFHNK